MTTPIAVPTAARLGCARIDDQFEFGCLLDWKVAGPGAFENRVHVGSAPALRVDELGSPANSFRDRGDARASDHSSRTAWSTQGGSLRICVLRACNNRLAAIA